MATMATSLTSEAMAPRSQPRIIDVHRFENDAAPRGEGARVDLLIEVPHGATATADYEAVAGELRSPLPEGLVEFFEVNTDAGAFELAAAVAQRFVEGSPTRRAMVLRSRIPRTFIDCNRRLSVSPEELRAGRVDPGLMPWVTAPEDRALLLARYEAYVAAVDAATSRLAPDAAMVMLHTYAPRTLPVQVDLEIVPNLRAAYRPELVETWPLRPEVDLITRTLEGEDHAPRPVVDALRWELAAVGITPAESATYPLHPSSLAWDHVHRMPGQALCLEVRRDLLGDFVPLRPVVVDPRRVARLAEPLARALGAFWERP